MVESYLRQSPLAHLGLDARVVAEPGEARLWLTERRYLTKINVRGQAIEKEVKKATGLDLPLTPNTTSQGNGLTGLWLGPDEWLIVGPPGAERALVEALDGAARAVIDVSEGRTVIRLAGPMARDVLAMGCPLDLHPSVFTAGQCAQSHLARTTIILDQVDNAPVYDVYVERSQADYLWTWFERAGEAYGVAIVAEPPVAASWRRPAKRKAAKKKDEPESGDAVADQT
ncbi:MAG: sarcosine oxidase subunit gamma family protein [Pseudomonadota bacterium]